jgi:hypothetical protein
MKDYKYSIIKNCPCTQKECPIRNNCVLCVSNHLSHKRHIPECMQDILRQDVANLSTKVELDASDIRQTKEFWKSFDKKKFLSESLAKQKK